MVILGVNSFMRIVDMKIEKSFLHRHSGMLLAGMTIGKLNLEKSVEHGFCGKSERERQGIARREWP